mgnify:CR=1 FL=1
MSPRRKPGTPPGKVGRPRTVAAWMERVSLRLPAAVLAQVDRIAAERHTTRGAILREAVERGVRE